MSPVLLLTLSALMLALPWALMPARRLEPEVHGRLKLLWWLNVAYCSFMHRLESNGPAPLPEQGPAILIANHTCGADNLILQAGCHRVLGFLIAKEFYDYWLCRPFCRILNCIPVNRNGRDLSATRAALRALKQGRVVPIFPEGTIHPTSGREIGEGKPGAAFIALHARVPVIPAYIRGTPITDVALRALITPSDARVVYGPPIDLSRDFPPDRPIDKEALAEATDRLMGAIRDLKERSTASNPSSDISISNHNGRPPVPAAAVSGVGASAVGA
jgi:1-acyl-sn-glycerol-3-phosphate acyltransferase